MEQEQEKEREQEKDQIAPMPEEATVGMFLKYTRLKQKKSIEAVSDALCIRKIYIKALEDDDYTTLEPIPYGVGFVRSYASYLGLNADRIANVYKQEAFPKKEKTTQTVVKQHNSVTIPNKKQIYFSLAAVIVLYTAWFLFSLTQNKAQTQSENFEVIEVEPLSEETEGDILQLEEFSDTEDEGLAEESDEQIMVTDSNYVENETPAKPKNSVILKFKGESWVEIQDAQKVYLSGTYNKGFEYTVPDTEGIILSFGKYYNVDVYINDVLTKVAGPQKQTKIKLDDFLKH